MHFLQTLLTKNTTPQQEILNSPLLTNWKFQSLNYITHLDSIMNKIHFKNEINFAGIKKLFPSVINCLVKISHGHCMQYFQQKIQKKNLQLSPGFRYNKVKSQSPRMCNNHTVP